MNVLISLLFSKLKTMTNANVEGECIVEMEYLSSLTHYLYQFDFKFFLIWNRE